MNTIEVLNQIKNGGIDPNNQSLFFKILIKGLLLNLNRYIRIRKKPIPHFIPNAGDELMILEAKGYDHSKDPLEPTNEDYIYTILPRCAVEPKGISMDTNQLTSPYSTGSMQLEVGDEIISLCGEFRRIPVKMSFNLSYLVDTYTDYLELCQQIISKLAFIRTYTISYLGQSITCSYSIPDSLDGENMIDFDCATTDDRRRKMELTIEVESNFPVYDEVTLMMADAYIKYPTSSPPSEGFKIYFPEGIKNQGPYEDPHGSCGHTNTLNIKNEISKR